MGPGNMRRLRRILGIIFFGVLMRDVIRASLAILLGVALAQRLPDILHLALGTMSILSASVFANIENDIADVELDRKVKAYRPLPRGKYTIKEARKASIIFLAASLSLAAVASAASRSLMLGLILAILPLATHLYSCPPTRLKSRSWLGVLTLALIYLSPLLAGYVVAGGTGQNVPIILVLFLVFFLATGVKDFEDVGVDRSFGISTPPVLHGVRATGAWLRAVAVILALLCGGFSMAYFHGGLITQALYSLALLPSAFMYLRRLARYLSTSQRSELMQLVKGCLWTMYVWPTAAGIAIFLGSSVLA